MMGRFFGPRITSSQLMESCAQSVAVGRINLALSAKRSDYQLFLHFIFLMCLPIMRFHIGRNSDCVANRFITAVGSVRELTGKRDTS